MSIFVAHELHDFVCLTISIRKLLNIIVPLFKCLSDSQRVVCAFDLFYRVTLEVPVKVSKTVI